MRKVYIYIACSLDGFIAKPGDNLSFLSLVEKEGEDYGYAQFTAGIDSIIIGRKTFDYVAREIGTQHYDNGERDIYVISHKERASKGRIRFYSGDIASLIATLRSKNGKDIYCDGGAEIIHELLKRDLIDELIISVIPVLLGEGIRLFKEGRPEQHLSFLSAKTFDTGLVQLHYKRNR